MNEITIYSSPEKWNCPVFEVPPLEKDGKIYTKFIPQSCEYNMDFYNVTLNNNCFEFMEVWIYNKVDLEHYYYYCFILNKLYIRPGFYNSTKEIIDEINKCYAFPDEVIEPTIVDGNITDYGNKLILDYYDEMDTEYKTDYLLNDKLLTTSNQSELKNGNRGNIKRIKFNTNNTTKQNFILTKFQTEFANLGVQMNSNTIDKNNIALYEILFVNTGKTESYPFIRNIQTNYFGLFKYTYITNKSDLFNTYSLYFAQNKQNNEKFMDFLGFNKYITTIDTPFLNYAYETEFNTVFFLDRFSIIDKRNNKKQYYSGYKTDLNLFLGRIELFYDYLFFSIQLGEPCLPIPKSIKFKITSCYFIDNLVNLDNKNYMDKGFHEEDTEGKHGYIKTTFNTTEPIDIPENGYKYVYITNDDLPYALKNGLYKLTVLYVE